MKRTSLKMMGLVMMIFMTSMVCAQERHGLYEHDGDRKERRERGDRKERMAEMLELTDEQRETMANLRMEMKKQVLPLKNMLGEKEARLQTLTTTENPDKKEIENIIREIGSIKTDIALIKNDHDLKVRAELTEDQRVKMDGLSGKMRGKRRHKGDR